MFWLLFRFLNWRLPAKQNSGIQLPLAVRAREGDSSMRNLLGGKGANLAEMSGIGLPVPPGFTITTEVCTYYYDNGRHGPPSGSVQAVQSNPHLRAGRAE